MGISQAVLSQYRRSCYEKGDIAAVEKQLEEFFRIKDEKKENSRKANHSKQRHLQGTFQLLYQKQHINQFVTASLKKELLLLMEMLELVRQKRQQSFCRTIQTQQYM